MPRSATPKAAPMSRKVTKVTSHSPSHSSGDLVFVLGLAVAGDDLGLRAFGPVHRVDLVGHGEHAVERRLEVAGQFAP